MKTKQIFLHYLSKFNAFGISDNNIEKLEKENITPIVSLDDNAYKRLDCDKPSPNAPTVAFLLGREKEHYTIDWNYAKAIAQSGCF